MENEKKIKKVYFTLTGTKYHYGMDFLEKGMKLYLEKEPDNKYDKEAIMVKKRRTWIDWLCGKQYIYSNRRKYECRSFI